VSGGDDRQYIPGVTTPQPLPITGQNSNAPLKPLTVATPPSANLPVQTCNTSGDCTGAFKHCLKDVADEVGICTRECEDTDACGTDANWLCTSGRWEVGNSDERNVCALACTLNIECPRGTSCDGNFCGTPCKGGNCPEAPACASHEVVSCVGDSVYWFNTCAEPEEVKQICAAGETCAFGQCLQGSTPALPPQSGCSGQVRRCASSGAVTIEDNCGAAIRSESCSGGKTCRSGRCECTSSSQKRCVSSKLWSLDSCGTLIAIVGSC